MKRARAGVSGRGGPEGDAFKDVPRPEPIEETIEDQGCCNLEKCKTCAAVGQLPANWETMSLGALWQTLNDPRRFGRPAWATLRAAEYLVQRNDPARLRVWLAKHTSSERAAIVKYIKQQNKA